VQTLADAYRPRPPTRYLVDGLIAVPSLNLVYGPPGSMKSVLLLDLAVCVAAGKPWLESLPVVSPTPVAALTVQQAPVFWLDLDNGQRRTHERVEAFATARQLPAGASFYFRSMPDFWLDASNRQSCHLLAEVVTELKAELVVIDNLGLALGDVDENSIGMAKVMGNFRRLAEDHGVAVILLHHQRKTNGSRGRKGESLRGHSSIEASLDLALCVEREGNRPDITLVPTKTRDFDVPPLGATFSYTHKPNTKELDRALFYGQSVQTGSDQQHQKIEAAILCELQAVKAAGEPSPNKGKLSKDVRDRLAADGVSAGLNAIGDVLTELVRNGTVVEQSGATTNEKLYHVP
jgi:hypothetical protein